MKRLALVLGALAAAWLGLSLWALRGERPLAKASHAVPPTQPADKPLVQRTPVPSPVAAQQVGDVESAKFEAPRVALPRDPAAAALDDPGPGPYLARYEGRSGRLSPHASVNARVEPIKNSSSSKDPELLVWPASTRVGAGKAGRVYASLLDASARLVVPERIEIMALNAQNTPLGPAATMQPQSAPAEAQYGYDLATSAPAVDPAAKPAPPSEYRFVVRATGTFAGKPYERVANGFFYAEHAGAKLDEASANVSFAHGNLELTLRVMTERAGNYYASAELWGGPAGDQPIAFARQRLGQLAPGAQLVTLLFGGQVIHDLGIDGPYTVRNVQLLQVDSIPPHEAEPIAALPATRELPVRDFY